MIMTVIVTVTVVINVIVAVIEVTDLDIISEENWYEKWKNVVDICASSVSGLSSFKSNDEVSSSPW